MNAFTKNSIFGLTTLLFFLLIWQPCLATEPIKIGILHCEKFPSADMMKNSLEMALEEIHRKGGINGNSIELIYEDDKGTARDGEMVVALVGGEVTLKRIYRKGQKMIRLQPSNPTLEALEVSAADVRVQGIVVGLLRGY